MQEPVDRYDQENGRLDQFYTDRLGTQLDRLTWIQQGLRAIATEFRINPESIDYTTNDIEGSDLIRFQVTLPLVGGYPNLRHFIDRVETRAVPGRHRLDRAGRIARGRRDAQPDHPDLDLLPRSRRREASGAKGGAA